MQARVVQAEQDIPRDEQPGNRSHLGSQRDVCLVDGGGERIDVGVGVVLEICEGRVFYT